MRKSRVLHFVSIALTLALLEGCGAAGMTAVTPQPVARQQLKPEYRVFYDALKDYGEWVSIEPVGFVFRPNVVWNQWEPFADGFWAPTDVYGWVWISSEPFGWATYHYGNWFYDQFQGWVWAPGSDWGPGWVRWSTTGQYVGWSPIPPPSGYDLAGSTLGASPPGSIHFAPVSALGSTNLSQHVVSSEKLGAIAKEAKPIRNPAERDGVTFNLGPPIDMVEHATGPLPRVKIEDLVPNDLGRRPAPKPASGGASQPTIKPAGEPLAPDDPAEITRRAAERAADEARQLSGKSGIVPASLSLVRPLYGPKPAAGAGKSAPKTTGPKNFPAASDSTH